MTAIFMKGAVGYGWTSIILHWLSAAAIVVLLLLGDSIALEGEPARTVHTTLGLSCWLLLAVRVAWRWVEGHPPRAAGQGPLSFAAGLVVHHLLLMAIALMLVSGPVAGLSSGAGVALGEIRLGDGALRHAGIHAAASTVHGSAAAFLVICIVFHVGGVVKHMAIDRDGTLGRMLSPQGNVRSAAATVQR